MKILSALLFAATLTAAAQVPQVPPKMQFAGITLIIRDDARKEIQKDVDALTQSPKHFNIKVERAKTYFPLIEKVFQEENVPTDLKFLVLQESALIADAVSVSNAVGYWQFKDFTAMEMGLRVDKEVDERMNIVSASRGAAKYLKKNNVFFNNWVYALQAYQMGAGGVLKSVKDSESGVDHMEITSKTYWYVKKFLAHKIAFEEATKGPGLTQVIPYESKTKKSLSDLAKEVSVDEAELKFQNKWAKSGVVPDDRTYTILIPVTGNASAIKLPAATASAASQSNARTTVASASATAKIKINGLPVIIALQGESAAAVAARGGVELSSFLSWNEMSATENTIPGKGYFLAKKRARATEAYHKVLPGETLWMISQQYGVRVRKLERFNRLASGASVKAGETLWLNAKRPRDASSVSNTSTAQVDNETFAWTSTEPVATLPSVAMKDTTSTIRIIPVVKVDESAPVEKEIALDTLKNTPPSSTQVETKPLPQTDSIISIVVKKENHVVQPKETLYAIAKLYNVGVMDLVTWNNLNLQEGIKPGQILKLSAGESAQKEPIAVEATEILHEVKQSDTLYSVARKYGVTIKELMEWNNKKDFSVTVGEKLKIIKK